MSPCCRHRARCSANPPTRGSQAHRSCRAGCKGESRSCAHSCRRYRDASRPPATKAEAAGQRVEMEQKVAAEEMVGLAADSGDRPRPSQAHSPPRRGRKKLQLPSGSRTPRHDVGTSAAVLGLESCCSRTDAAWTNKCQPASQSFRVTPKISASDGCASFFGARGGGVRLRAGGRRAPKSLAKSRIAPRYISSIGHPPTPGTRPAERQRAYQNC
jgi:hypothetical protein